MHEMLCLQDKTCPGRWMGEACPAGGSGRPRLYRDHSRIARRRFADVLARSSMMFYDVLQLSLHRSHYNGCV